MSLRTSCSKTGTHGYLDHAEFNLDLFEFLRNSTWIDAMPGERWHALFYKCTILDASTCATSHRQGQKTFPPTYWKQLYTTAIKEGPTLRMAKSTETTKIAKPDMKKCSLPQLGSHMTETFLSQGLRQMVEQSRTRLSMKPASTYSVVNVDASRQEWLSLPHLLATHRPTHLQHDYTTILIQTGDFMPGFGQKVLELLHAQVHVYLISTRSRMVT